MLGGVADGPEAVDQGRGGPRRGLCHGPGYRLLPQMFRPAGSLPTPIAPTAVFTHSAAVASMSEPITVGYLPVPRLC